MFLALHLHAPALEAVLRHRPETRRRPCALAGPAGPRTAGGAETLLAANPAAARRGVVPGLHPTRALARCPELQILERDPESETRALRELLEAAESLTPDFELTRPDTLLLAIPPPPSDIRPPLDADARRRLEALGMPLRIAVGPTPDLAHLFALGDATGHRLVFRGPDSRWKPAAAGTLRQLLHRLPLALARELPDPAPLDALEPWGVRSLGELAELPRQGLAERLGPPLLQLHDLLHGKHPRPLTLFKTIETFDSIESFEHSIHESQALIFRVQRLIQTILPRLRSRYQSVSIIRLNLSLETLPEHVWRISLPEPSADPAVLLRAIATHLETLRLPAPVTALKLSLTPAVAPDGQHDLFHRGIRQPHRLADTFVRLTHLLGEDRIGIPVPEFTHRPDAFHLLPPATLFRPGAAAAPPGASSAAARTSLPLSRFRPPPEIAVAWEADGARPVPLALLTGPHRGRVTDRHGPFPLSGDWWDPARRWNRLEWDLRLESGELLRLAHLPPETWTLQGRYR